MWLRLVRGSRNRLRIQDRQSIWPAPDGRDAELIIKTAVEVEEEVIHATPRVVRLHYEIKNMHTTMTLGNAPPAPWPDAAKVTGSGFEMMLTERGPLVVPAQGARLPNRLASWLSTVAENVRGAWPVPPDGIQAGSEWRLTPAIPGGLPPGTTSAATRVAYTVTGISQGTAKIAVKFGLRVVLEALAAGQAKKGRGIGDAAVKLDRNAGVLEAQRSARMELPRETLTNQLARSHMSLRRVL